MTELDGLRWLVVTEEDVLPADSGGRVDHAGFLRAARDAGIAVRALVPSQGFNAPLYAGDLPGVEVVPLPRRSGARHHLGLRPYVVATRDVPEPQLLAAAGERRDAVISYSVRSAHLGEAVARAWRVPHLVRCQNLDSAYFRDLARAGRGARSFAYRVEGWRVERFETHLNRSPDVTAFADVSAEEAAHHRTLTDHPVLHVPSFALPRDSGEVPGMDARAGVLFVGSLDVETNQQALAWFLTEVWPRVRAAAPAATFRIVGRRPTDELRAEAGRLSGEGVSLHGDVPEVDPFFHGAAVNVNPAQTGSGINVKLLQAMVGGSAAVSTSVGAAGIDWEVGEDLLVADAPQAFADAVVRLLTDVALRSRVAARGRESVLAKLDPVANLRAFAEVLAR
ncbi:MAG TPA: glycosyltransferase [Mycobacteriales bacterium]|nr:glycosyltransferase [Mycobacteriales bacterium]